MENRSAAAADAAFFSHVGAIIAGGRLQQAAAHRQHGTTSTLLHCIAVAYEANRLARRFGLGPDALHEVRRAALLHDYYLYDWHVPAAARPNHAFKHPSYALQNARADYPDLTEREADAIRCHMFPLVPRPPRHTTGWIVTLADKICASRETARRHGGAYPKLRALCARHLPNVALDLPAVPSHPKEP